MEKEYKEFYNIMNKIHFYDYNGNLIIDLEELIEDDSSRVIPSKLYGILTRVWYIIFDNQEIADEFSKLIEKYIDIDFFNSLPCWDEKNLTIDNKSIWHYANDEWKPIFKEIKDCQNEMNKLFDFVRSVISYEKN